MKKGIEKKMNFKKLFIFALPSIIMMVFMSSYQIVDSFFVSTYVGSKALAALNIVYPIIGLIFAIGVMFETGGSALVGRLLGENNYKGAKQSFTLIVIVTMLFNLLFLAMVIPFLNPILRLLGCDDTTLAHSRNYSLIILMFSPACLLQLLFQGFFVVDSKPRLGLTLTIISGLANMLFDYVFMGPLNMGIEGAAYATSLGYLIGGVGGLIFFIYNRKGLCFVKPKFNFSWVRESMSNGASEMINNLAASIVTLLFNIYMMRLVGTNGIAAITVILYAQYAFNSFFMGYAIGVAPVFSYHYGACNGNYVRKIRNESYYFIIAVSIVTVIISISSATLVGNVFSNGSKEIYDLIVRGTYLFSFNYLIAGVNIFNSSMFTALSDGKTSALISFMRTLLFIILGMIIMGEIWGTDGLFLAVPVAELLTLLVTLTFYHHQYKKLDNEMKEDIDTKMALVIMKEANNECLETKEAN